jgi:hypothetical protein
VTAEAVTGSLAPALRAGDQLVEARVAVGSAQASVTGLDLPAVTERPGVILEKQSVAERAKVTGQATCAAPQQNPC